jgi:hypothetical protein
MTKKWASLIAGVVIGLICIILVVIVLVFVTPRNRQFSIVTPEITIIEAPALPPVVDSTPTQAAEAIATESNLPPDPGSAIQVGMTVHISGTGGDGLRIRQEPGVNSTPLFLGADNEEFLVKAGPELVDNLTWWYLEAPFDDKRQGWAAANYLSPN